MSFAVEKGETLAIVGESGCGKSVTAKSIMGLIQAPGEIKPGSRILYEGRDILKMKKREWRAYRGEQCAMIFQDALTSLDPTMRVGKQIAETLRVHGRAGKAEAAEKAVELLRRVGIPNPERRAQEFPHQFSGGQRQRIGIARAFAVNPDFIMCDEPISALDVSIQAQIVNLLVKLQREMGLTYLFIAHDLAMVKHISDRIAVMYLGTLVELTESERLYDKPLHPYTQALLSAIPIPDPEIELTRERIRLEGDIPSPVDPPPGCRFAGRCSRTCARCRRETPALREVEPGHFVACHLV